MIRPRLVTVLVFLAGVPLALAIVIADPAAWPFTLDFGALVLVAAGVDAAIGLPRRALQVEVTGPDQAYIGETVSIRIDFGPVRRSRPVRFEILVEQSGPAERQDIVAATSSPGDAWAVTVPVVPKRRGRIEIAAVWLRWSGPLGLVERLCRVPVGRGIDVVPNIRGLTNAGLQFLAEDARYGIKVQNQKGEGSEFDALRDYVPGLDRRGIDWKRSAKHRKLLCKEYQTERNHQIVLAFDTGHLMQEPIGGMTRLDHAINAGLLLTWVSLKCGDLVGAYAFDAAVRHYTPPGRGMTTFARIQHASAGLAYHPFETNFTLGLAEINNRLKRRALIVVFTDFVDTVSAELLIDNLALVANRHAVLFVTLRDNALEGLVEKEPTAFGDVADAVIAHDFIQDRAVVFERLQRLGASCLDVTPGGLSVAVVNRYLAIKRAGLIG